MCTDVTKDYIVWKLLKEDENVVLLRNGIYLT